MPQRAGHPCGAPNCAEIAKHGERFCKTHHGRTVSTETRPTAHQRGYDARWRKLRAIILARDPVCVDPYGVHKRRKEAVLTTDIDHIVPKADGGRDTADNLQGLCHSCHSRKTEQQTGFGRRGRGKKSQHP